MNKVTVPQSNEPLLAFDNLPVELIEQIYDGFFEYSSIKELLDLRLVCKSFDDTIIGRLVRYPKIMMSDYRDHWTSRIEYWKPSVPFMARMILHDKHGNGAIVGSHLDEITLTTLSSLGFDVADHHKARDMSEYTALVLAFCRANDSEGLLTELWQDNLGFSAVGQSMGAHLTAASAVLGRLDDLRIFTKTLEETGHTSLLYGEAMTAAAASNQVRSLQIIRDAPDARFEPLMYLENALYMAAVHNAKEALQTILCWRPADGFTPNQPAQDIEEALFDAATHGNHTLFQIITPYWKVPQHRVNALNRVMYPACLCGHWRAVEELIGLGANPNQSFHIRAFDPIDMVDIRFAGDCDAPITIAVRLGYAKTVEVLLKNGANPNHAPSRRYDSTVLAAVKGDSVMILKLLLQYGADPTGRQAGLMSSDTLLSYIAGNGKLGMVKAIIDHGTDLKYDQQGLRALCNAAQSGHVDTVEYLVEHAGVNVNGILHLDGQTTTTAYDIVTDWSPHQHKIVDYLKEKGAVSLREWRGQLDTS